MEGTLLIKRIWNLKICIYTTAWLGIACAVCGCGKGEDAYDEGVKAMKSENYAEAVNHFKEAVDANKDKAEYAICYGMALIHTGGYEEAIAQFDSAISEKDNKIVRENNKQAYRGKGIASYNLGDYTTAIENFRTALDIPELSELNDDMRGYILDIQLMLGETKKALDICTECIDKDPKNAGYYLKRGQLYQKLEKYDAAIHDFDEALSYDDEQYECYFGKYEANLSLMKEEEARKALEQVVQIKVKTGADSCFQGRAYQKLGDLEKAKSCFEEAAEEEYADAYFYLGNMLKDEKKYDQALENYNKYVELLKEKSGGVVYNQMALCQAAQGDYEAALQSVETGLARKDADIMKELMKNQVIIVEKTGDFATAKTLASDYLKQFPDDEEMERELTFIKTRVVK